MESTGVGVSFGDRDGWGVQEEGTWKVTRSHLPGSLWKGNSVPHVEHLVRGGHVTNRSVLL